MKNNPKFTPSIPAGPRSIQKGSSLAELLNKTAVEHLAANIRFAHSDFKVKDFIKDALNGLKPLGILDRGQHLATAMQRHLPPKFNEAAEILIRSLTPPLDETSDLGLAPFFYLPHVSFAAQFGIDPKFNAGKDPFPMAMKLQYELTRRFSAEFSIRQFIIHSQERTMKQLMTWTSDRDPHVRRLCSEGSRPRLPWATRIPQFIKDPSPALPILEKLKDDESLYVRRSVANHLGDIAKDHPHIVFDICEKWLEDASHERKWMIRHAVRHPAKKGVKAALRLRKLAK